MNSLLLIFPVIVHFSSQALDQDQLPEIKEALTLRKAAQAAVHRAQAAIEAAEKSGLSLTKRNEMVGIALQKSQTAVKRARAALTETKSVLYKAEAVMREHQSKRETFFDAKMRSFKDENRASAEATLKKIRSTLRKSRNMVTSLQSAKTIALHIETQVLDVLKKAQALQSLQYASSCHKAVAG